MVTAAELRRRIDIDLRTVKLSIDDLAELEREWPSETDINRQIAFQEWEDVMARWRFLRDAFRAGQFTDEQERRWQAIGKAINRTRPSIERLGLFQPAE
ncbi:MAG: hypothetical protein ACRDJE_07635 [Dehalococcoidia bacterium]